MVILCCLFVYVGLYPVMIHEVPESYNLQVQSSVQVPIGRTLPVKGPDVASFEVEA